MYLWLLQRLEDSVYDEDAIYDHFLRERLRDAPRRGWATPTYEEILDKKRQEERAYRCVRVSRCAWRARLEKIVILQVRVYRFVSECTGRVRVGLYLLLKAHTHTHSHAVWCLTNSCSATIFHLMF